MLASYFLFALVTTTSGSPLHYSRRASNTTTLSLFDSLTTTCDLDQSRIPSVANFSSSLPAPDGQRLRYVAVGRGIQNYTCDSSTTAATPAAIGAIATLYNANCILKNYPSMIDNIPDILLQFSIHSTKGDIIASDAPNILGHHRFGDSTTAVFDLNTASHEYGQVIAHKAGSMNAPSNSPLGQVPSINGAVAWLYLLSSADSTADITSVYRTHTAGGSPPATCKGQKSGVLSVEYAALYWFFSR
ncbi:hypothetical protein BGW36DRAFT_306250 [Talaromyces proteolyticus]|uniref:Malate dehydrogenase n=1 Tax=Talaromyces proteolyticus TaxID=1131652 RepID=A0AAD4KJ06_9EURO|nr:uncharacterized protein BGW36DRAFT_306250 [Talaromyces proteolyticus]KAH8690482.1 hypothetical protein BGW36DRAFT_306250 [Talaromyces proteolyticus]